jgi:hypothetical protein
MKNSTKMPFKCAFQVPGLRKEKVVIVLNSTGEYADAHDFDLKPLAPHSHKPSNLMAKTKDNLYWPLLVLLQIFDLSDHKSSRAN